MTPTSRPSKWPLAILAAAIIGLATVGGQAAAASALTVTPGLYALTIETLMPHLEVNLRYATTRVNRCLDRQQVLTLFPVMQQDTFVDCGFERTQAQGGRIEFTLSCRNAEAATGTARFSVKESDFRGVLEVKMGGKNMKFSQIVSGLRVGTCTPDD